MSRFGKLLLVLIVLSFCTVGMGAIVNDATGDFLATYTAGPKNADMDVISAELILDVVNSTLTFRGTQAGDIGTTSGAIYIFGLNRGVGIERFQKNTPKIGAGIFFDATFQLKADGTAQFNDTVTGINTSLPAGTAIIIGNTISSIALPLSLFPSQGFTPENYTWNYWPRVGLGQNNQVADFAMDGGSSAVTIIPEPLTLCLLGLGVFGLRRRV